MAEKKTCFVVTPIGDDNTAIRRHIDGIIDQAIIPAIEEEFNVKVAHREYKIGSINDRVIQSVYNADLVIANLTGLNSNVMFELAIRYSFGKPAIVIAEEGTKLPFDIIDENTLFYINDPAGAADLRDRIVKFVDAIKWNKNDYGPVFSAVRKAAIVDGIETNLAGEDKNAFSFLIQKISDLEMAIKEKGMIDSSTEDYEKSKFYEIESIINRERSVFRRRWEKIKKEEPFDLEKAEGLISDIEVFIENISELKQWTVNERRYFKGKMSFILQDIRNYIYHEKNPTQNVKE